jgi:hypothetical protein
MSEVLVSVAIAVIAGVIIFLQNRGKTKAQLLNDFKNNVLSLFLYAEKQEWIGPDKMKWCVDQVYKFFPDIIKKFITQQTVEEWMQDFYDDIKSSLKVVEVPAAEPAE